MRIPDLNLKTPVHIPEPPKWYRDATIGRPDRDELLVEADRLDGQARYSEAGMLRQDAHGRYPVGPLNLLRFEPPISVKWPEQWVTFLPAPW